MKHLSRSMIILTAALVGLSVNGCGDAEDAEATAVDSTSAAATALPASYIYCDADTCTPVKDQGWCGGAAVFATTGAFEQLLKKAGTTRILSEAHLMACNTSGRTGCSAGSGPMMPWYYDTPDKTGRIGAVYASEYKGSPTGPCVAAPHHERLSGWGPVATQGRPTPEALKAALYTYGPLWVTVCADSDFWSYRSGVFAGSSCTTPNHVVVLTGWDDKTQSFLLRNSWGSFWGERGYMRIKYGANGVGDWAYYLRYGEN